MLLPSSPPRSEPTGYCFLPGDTITTRIPGIINVLKPTPNEVLQFGFNFPKLALLLIFGTVDSLTFTGPP